MTVADVFVIRGRGLVATGTAEAGGLRVGEEVAINGGRRVRVTAIESFRKQLDAVPDGENVGLLLADATREDVGPGDVLTAAEAPDAQRVFRDAGLGA